MLNPLLAEQLPKCSVCGVETSDLYQNDICQVCLVENNNNEKGEVNMTKLAKEFKKVYSKEIKNTVTGKREKFLIQVQMVLDYGKTQIKVNFGHSGLGGRQTFLAVGSDVKAVSRKDFLDGLRTTGIENVGAVEKALKHLEFFKKDDYIVSKCECCDKGFVTAANVDYIQRNYDKLTAKLGREVFPHSVICYKCQGHEGKKQEAKKPVETPAQANAVTCSCCGKNIKSKAVIDRSRKEFGKPVCYPVCQDKLRKGAPVEQPVKQETKKEELPKQEASSVFNAKLSREIAEEILGLDVAEDSRLFKLQQALAGFYKVETVVVEEIKEEPAKKVRHCSVCGEAGHTKRTCPNKPTGKKDEAASEASVEGAGVISAPEVMECSHCMVELPANHTGEYCDACELDMKEFQEEAARKFQMNACIMESLDGIVVGGEQSEPQEEASDESESENQEDAQEVPVVNEDEGAVCSSPVKEAGSHDSDDEFLNLPNAKDEESDLETDALPF